MSSQLASLPATNYYRSAIQLLTFTNQNKIWHPLGQFTIGMTKITQVTNTYHLFNDIWMVETIQISQHHVGYARRQRWRSKWLLWNSDEQVNTASQLPLLAHTLTSHHFYSLNERACQIPLKVQVTKTIQMPCFFGALVKQGTFHYHREWKRRHTCLSTPAKLGENSCMLHMPSISIIRNKTVTGTQSQLAAYPLKSFNYEAPVEYIFKPSLSAECNCC